MTLNQTQFEKKVQRAQKAIAAIGKGLPPEAVTSDLIAKVRSFLSTQVADLARDLEILERSGVKRGVFSLDAPADPSPAPGNQPQFTMPSVIPGLLPNAGPVGTLTGPVAVTKLPLLKPDQVVGKLAPPELAREVLKTAEDAPDRVRVFGDRNAVPSAGEGDVDFQEE